MRRAFALALPSLALSCVALSCMAIGGCGEPRRYGDTGGAPVKFQVKLEKPFFDAMSNRQWRPSVGAGAGFSSGGHSGVGAGVGFTFSSTEVFLLGGEAVAQADVFRQELKWGDNAFTVPLTPGRTLTLTVQAEGGREGWESLGTITVPNAPDAQVAITLAAGGGTVAVTPAPAPAAAPGPAPAGK
jgi:hypothetical protein